MKRKKEEFTNFGLVDDFVDCNLFDMRVDSWFYDDFTPLGQMAYTRPHMEDPLQIAQEFQIAFETFTQSFAPVLHPRSSILLAYKHSGDPVKTLTDTVQYGEIIRFVRYTEEASGKVWELESALARLDSCLFIRDEQGSIAQQVLYNSGDLAIRIADRQVHVSVQLGAGSILLPDNSGILHKARERWRQVRSVNPLATWDEEGDEDSLVVTLVEPPSDTPLDNHTLCDINLPIMQSAIEQWSKHMGEQFMLLLGERNA